MSDTGETPAIGKPTQASEAAGAVGKLNKGQGLVAAFRAARISQRPALKAGLRHSRTALRQERLQRLGLPETTQAASVAPTDAAAHDDTDPASKPEPAPPPAAGTSVFATYLDRAETPAEPAPAAAEAAPAQQAPGPDAAPPDSAAHMAAAPEPEPRLPLSSIGFGPGMMIRMSHLGIESVQELAAADPTWLRGALGDISRLINVDLWIASARNACSKAA
jgi:predicted flap endonuclease-1-like 5' DNA nuclease